MELMLIIVGIAILLFSVIAGLFSGSISEFFASAAGGFTSAITFFALAKILYNQGDILYRLRELETVERKQAAREQQLCENCQKQYDGDMSSCPYCGYRNKDRS